jgi:DNA polymerase-3 subunit gamma/tau
MAEELYRKYRPQRLKDMIGQPEAVSILSNYIKTGKIPHVILFSGKSGAGKTTLARILKSKLNCSDSDFIEKNCAEARGIDDIRSIQSVMSLAPMNGTSRIWLLDEAARLTKDSQSALLKTLEDTPDHVYFMLATTDPEGLLPTIKNRCCILPIKPISEYDLYKILKMILEKEQVGLSDVVLNKIADCADGSARQAIQLMEKALQLPTEQEQLAAIVRPESEQRAFELVQALLWQKKKWPEIAAIISAIPKGEDHEGIRHLILKNANNELLKPKGNWGRAHLIITNFSEPWFNCKLSALAACCYEVSQMK